MFRSTRVFNNFTKIAQIIFDVRGYSDPLHTSLPPALRNFPFSSDIVISFLARILRSGHALYSILLHRTHFAAFSLLIPVSIISAVISIVIMNHFNNDAMHKIICIASLFSINIFIIYATF